MPQLLRDSDSSEKHLAVTRRHHRLCRRIKGAEAFATRLEPFHQALQSALAKRTEAEQSVEDAIDDLAFSDGHLDDLVQALFEDAGQYDRANPGNEIRNMLFPEGKWTTVTRAGKGEEEANLAEQLASRLDRLPAEHELASYSAKLKEAATACRTDAAAVRAAHEARGTARGAEEYEQAALRKQYEANALDARKIFGRAAAERLFPEIRSSSKSKEDAPASEN